MKAFIDDCIKANQEIYEYINTHISSTDYNYSGKIGFGGDKSSNIDLLTEQIFIKYLAKYGDIYSEECGLLSSSSKYKIIIDPLDGSDNFMSSLPYYGTSVALQENNKTLASMVCNLADASLIYKIKNDETVRISLLSLEKITKYEYENTNLAIFERAYAYPEISKKLFEKKIKFRSLGAVALSLSDAKYYSFVLFFGKIREFDIVAAMHICEGLNVYSCDEFLIVAKSNSTFELIKDIINK